MFYCFLKIPTLYSYATLNVYFITFFRKKMKIKIRLIFVYLIFFVYL